MEKLTLASALGKLDEGAECITRERSAGFHELKITKGGGCYHKWSRHDGNSHFFVEENNSTPIDNWQVYYEPKFKVGDLVAWESPGEEDHESKIFGVIKNVDDCPFCYISIGDNAFNNLHQDTLLLVLTAKQLEKKFKEES